MAFEKERRLISERTKAALAVKKQRGEAPAQYDQNCRGGRIRTTSPKDGSRSLFAAVYSTFSSSVHNVLLHKEPRRLDALRSAVAISEVAWLGTYLLCGGPK